MNRRSTLSNVSVEQELSQITRTTLSSDVKTVNIIRAKRVSNWYTPQKKSARLPACTCQIILVLVFTHVSTTYVRTSARYQPATDTYMYLRMCQGGVRIMCHIYMFVNWCKKHVFCTWHQPAPMIRICRYVCTRDTKDIRALIDTPHKKNLRVCPRVRVK